MRTKICTAAVVAMGIATVSASAADLGPGAYGPGYNWMGPYLGLNVGYQLASVTNNPTNPSGFAGGIQGGFNWQTGSFVFGAETDLQLSTADDRFASWKFTNPWFGTLRGRAGVAFNNILVYGTGGVAYGGLRAELAGLSQSRVQLGWTAGVGLEVGFGQHWSAKVEYLYFDLGSQTYTVTGTRSAVDSNLLRLGLNFRF